MSPSPSSLTSSSPDPQFVNKICETGAGLGWADISPFVGRNVGTIHLLRDMYFEQFVNPASKHVQILILS